MPPVAIGKRAVTPLALFPFSIPIFRRVDVISCLSLQFTHFPMSNSISVVAIANARTGKESMLFDAMRECIAPTRLEAGCITYVLHQDADTPSRFVLLEQWESVAALDAHKQTPHFLKMAAAINPLLDGTLQIFVLNPRS